MTAIHDKVRSIESDLAAGVVKIEAALEHAMTIECHDTAFSVLTVLSLHLEAARAVANKWLAEERGQ